MSNIITTKKMCTIFVLVAIVLMLSSCGRNESLEESIAENQDETSTSEGDNDKVEPEKVPNEWKITQYGDTAESVMMFYTIEDFDGNFIIIDGGYDTNADKVREVIAAHNNHVTAWIITHPHPDHVMAFNEIMKNPGEITVDTIYTIEVNYNAYKETAEWFDKFEVYEDFLSVTKDLENVIFLKENDELDLIELHMKVLHVWDEHTETLDVNTLNNGSMVFTLEGNEEKMLFCADVENETEQIIIERHLDDLLDVDYVQLGHHGNWGMTTAFYEYLSPKAVFFDVPAWLVNEENGNYDAWILRDYFKSRQIKMYIVNPEPNQIILR